MNKELFNRTGNLISCNAYNRAHDIYSEWYDDLKDYDTDDLVCINEDFSPQVDQITERVWEELIYMKLDCYPENILGDEISEEELDCYYNMTDDDVRKFIDEGLQRFEKGFGVVKYN